MPHYRDGDNQKPRSFLRLIEEVILPRLNVEAIPPQLRFHECGIDRVFGTRRFRTSSYWNSIGDDQTSTVHQRIVYMREYDAWLPQFVIGIRDEHPIHRTGYMRIIRLAANNPDILNAGPARPYPQKRQRQAQYVDSLHISARANRGRKLQSKVSRAATEIHDAAAIVEIQLSDDLGRTLPGVALTLHKRQTVKGAQPLTDNVQQTQNQQPADKPEGNLQCAIFSDTFHPSSDSASAH